MIGSTPSVWGAKRQSLVQASTFVDEFTALKKAVEEAITIRYHLQSMGVKISKPTPTWMDNMGVVLNASSPGSPLNKKHIALSYRFVREHQANNVVSIRKIDTTNNYGDPFTKALTNDTFHNFFQKSPRQPYIMTSYETTYTDMYSIYQRLVSKIFQKQGLSAIQAYQLAYNHRYGVNFYHFRTCRFYLLSELKRDFRHNF